MPRISNGPQLILYGPPGPECKRRKARPKKGLKSFVYYAVWYEHGQKRERSSGTGDSEQAHQWFAEWLGQRTPRPDGPRHPHEITIGEILTFYGEEHAPHAKDSARIGYCIKALLPYWGDKLASTVKAETSRAYWRHREKLGIKPGTYRRELGCLNAALKYCAKEGYITHNPVALLPEKPGARERWLTRQEAARLLRAARNEPKARHHLPLFILIGLYMGPRKEAALAMQWQPNTEGGWFDLERGLADFNPMRRAQTKKRRVKAPIPDRLLRFLRYARRRTSKYVFEQDGVDEKGRPIKKQIRSIKRSFATACEKAGLHDVSPHILKHTAITWLLQRGVPTREVAGFTGTSEDTIDRVYGHHAPDFMQRAKEALR